MTANRLHRLDGSTAAVRRLVTRLTWRRRADDHGSLAVALVLLTPALMTLVGLVVDGGAAFTAHQAAEVEAEQAARAGAGMLDPISLRRGVLQLDSAQAVAAAEALTAVAGHPGSATANGTTVTVRVAFDVPTSVLDIVGIDRLHVVASASAANLQGVAVGRP